MKASVAAAALSACFGIVAPTQSPFADADDLFPPGPRPDHPSLVRSGEIKPDDPLFAELLGEPAPAGVPRPLRFELAAPFELPPPTEADLQEHRAKGGMRFPSDPRPPGGQARAGAVRLNLVYCGWVLYQGEAVAGDLAYRYEYRVSEGEDGVWWPTGMSWRRLEQDEIVQCRGGDAAP
jgi:hypothetical protein